MRKGHSDVVAALLQHAAGVHLNRSIKLTALLMAAYHGDAATAEQLLGGPASAELLTARNGGAALRAAAAGGQVALASLLLRHGVHPDNCDVHDMTPLMLAAANGRLDAVGLLLDEGADPYLLDRRLNSAFMYAAARGHAHIVHLLFQRRVDPICALKGAVDGRQPAMVLDLLRRGAPLDDMSTVTLSPIVLLLEQECQASGVVCTPVLTFALGRCCSAFAGSACVQGPLRIVQACTLPYLSLACCIAPAPCLAQCVSTIETFPVFLSVVSSAVPWRCR